MRKLLTLALLLIAISPVHAAIFGPLFSGSSQVAPPAGHAPVVASNPCTIALPVVNSTNVNLVGGGSCAYTATCNDIPCNGGDAITAWAITTQSTANSFSIVGGTGVLQGGSAGGSVTTGSYTVTVTAANSTGTSPGVVQTISVFQPPVVASLPCTIKSPITNNTNVTLQAGGTCQYTATCGGGACSGGNAISSWSVTADTTASAYQVTSSGVLQGSTNAATVTNQTDTVTVIATNAGGNSPGVGQTVTAVTVPVITNQNLSLTLPITNGMSVGTMHASPAPTSWAITAVSGDGATTSDFAISSGGAITTAQASPPGGITSSGTVTISLTATNATGPSATGTATVTISGGAGNPYASVDGSPNAPGDTGNALYTFFQNPTSIATPVANPLAKYHAGGHADSRVFGTAGPPNYAPGDPNYYQPPWYVAGIDYPVGIRPAFLPLKTDILTNPPACATPATSSAGYKQITITSSNCPIQGYDLSVSGGVIIFINSGLTNILISDNYYKATTNRLGFLLCNNSAVTVQYNSIDGNKINGTADGSGNTNNGSGNLIQDCWHFNYNYITQAEQDTFNYGLNQTGTTSSTQGLFVNFNAILDTGCGGGHADVYQIGTANGWNVNFNFDFLWQRGAGNSLCATTEGTQGIFFTGSTANQTEWGTVKWTTWITAKDTGGGGELTGFAQVSNGVGDGVIVSPGVFFQNNYADPTGISSKNWTSIGTVPGGGILGISSNMNMLNGLSDAAAGWNHVP